MVLSGGVLFSLSCFPLHCIFFYFRLAFSFIYTLQASSISVSHTFSSSSYHTKGGKTVFFYHHICFQSVLAYIYLSPFIHSFIHSSIFSTLYTHLNLIKTTSNHLIPNQPCQTQPSPGLDQDMVKKNKKKQSFRGHRSKPS